MNGNRQVICAGCSCKFDLVKTTFYRNKRWCYNPSCKDIIDLKVKHANYKKAQKKLKNGTFRHGVNEELRTYIRNRDDLTCRLCINKLEPTSAQVHHIIPVSFGGTDIKTNLVLLCYDCHVLVHQDGWEKYMAQLTDYTTKIAESVR